MHRHDQHPHSINFNAIPNFLQFLPQILLVNGLLLRHSYTTIYFIPKVFYRIRVRRLKRMPNELKLLCQQPLCNILRSMFGVVVVLENNILLSSIMHVYSIHKLHLQNFIIHMFIHIPFYKTKVVNSLPSHTSPNHNVSTPQF